MKSFENLRNDMIIHLLQDNTIVRNGYVMNNNKIVEFTKYVEKYEKINRSFEEQVEAEILTIDEVREKRKEMTKKLENKTKSDII